jgi:[ribosomal protein S18]-alanine N-acetyltransferase
MSTNTRTKELIRAGNIGDVAAIMELASAAKTAAQWTEQQYRQIFSGNMPERRALVMECDSRMLGFLVARASEEEWELENILISPQEQRRGLGFQLLKECLRIAHGSGALHMYLEVRESNRPARFLYEKCGFLEAGRRKRYYRDPEEDAILYTHQLDGDAPSFGHIGYPQ